MTLEVREVRGRRGTAAFVDVAWQVQGGRGRWIPPLRAMVRDGVDDRKNPFYGRAERALFVVERSGRPVGRVAAIHNRAHLERFGDGVGFFGFFECVDDPDAALSLLKAAEGWLSERGIRAVRGPMNPSMHHELGILVDGFDAEPAIMTPWNPPYYGPLVEGAGYSQVRDLLAYDVGRGDPPVPERLMRLAERKGQRLGVTFRSWTPKTFEGEARRVFDLYCEAWEDNWGFVRPTWEEFWHIAKDLKAVLHPDFAFVAEVEDHPVGFIMIARDLNRVLRDIPSGRLWPWNIVKLMRGVPKVVRGRIVLLGFSRDFRNRGLFPVVAAEIARRAEAIGAEGAEASWILEENEALRAPLESMGFLPTKRWRIFEKELA